MDLQLIVGHGRRSQCNFGVIAAIVRRIGDRPVGEGQPFIIAVLPIELPPAIPIGEQLIGHCAGAVVVSVIDLVNRGVGFGDNDGHRPVGEGHGAPVVRERHIGTVGAAAGNVGEGGKSRNQAQ